ncbi:(S)-2-haloacid dehalogenase [Gracilibacillus boraciitolerans JCM 21714]|uniref:(S)-2-haloacid dehalogenase n=1 Tax=Gracilibacillus boraciitolerans JCM 21714 TaxID=1298598 RepID=W4VQV6_9BACI|nr:haloacid dehalogenase type II [Gracilibacillus boraciitolerans]GAE95304.1 (S)-2-haloacid dehalogenase [Gracilibacillus boraciitolerans JCM 21714]
MNKNGIKALVFDAYGTLFDVHSVIEKCNELFDGKGVEISKTWREKQLEYANLHQIMGNYKSFYQITNHALHYAVKLHDEQLDKRAENELLKAYLQLSTFPEVKDVLTQLQDKKLAVFSNGSHDMLDPLIKQSKITDIFDQIISVDEIKQFKPAVASYKYAAKELKVKPEEVLFMSSNGWDISGAKNYGFHTAWINRQNLPIEEMDMEPTIIYHDLTGILEWK